MKRKFYLYKRGNFYYASLINPKTNKKLPARSTKETTIEAASEVATRWFYHGFDGKNVQPIDHHYEIDNILNRLQNIPDLTSNDIQRFLNLFQKKGLLNKSNGYMVNAESFVDFLLGFWDYEESLYIREKLSYGHRIGKRRCHEAKGAILRHWKPFFNNKALLSIDKNSLMDFALSLKKKGLSAKTINNITDYGTVPLKWAYTNSLILSNPTIGLHKFSGKARKRGILTDNEISELFSRGDWHGNDGAKIGNFLAMQSGLRSGEIVALRLEDINIDRLIINHSYSAIDGLKSTKNGENREVPLLPETREMILNYYKRSPHSDANNHYVFFQESSANRPMRQETLRKRLSIALSSIGVSLEEQKRRGLCFHSWRHLYATKMSAVLAERTMKLTGHKTTEVFEAYANHMETKDFDLAYQTTINLFSKLIQ